MGRTYDAIDLEIVWAVISDQLGPELAVQQLWVPNQPGIYTFELDADTTAYLDDVAASLTDPARRCDGSYDLTSPAGGWAGSAVASLHFELETTVGDEWEHEIDIVVTQAVYDRAAELTQLADAFRNGPVTFDCNTAGHELLREHVTSTATLDAQQDTAP